MLVDTTLVKNLDNADYMTLLLNGKANLEELFASMDPMIFNNEIEQHSGVDRILPGFKKIIKLPALPEYFLKLTANANTRRSAQSN